MGCLPHRDFDVAGNEMESPQWIDALDMWNPPC